MIFIKLIFIICFLGILITIFKKAPHLLQLPPEQKLKKEEENIPKKKIIDIENWEKNFSSSLGKLFKKIRIFALKLENFSAKLSKRFQERSKVLSESKKDYWEKFKTENKSEEKTEGSNGLL